MRRRGSSLRGQRPPRGIPAAEDLFHPRGRAQPDGDTNPAQTAPWGELVRATVADGFLAPPLQHDGPVYAATFDATGERVVTASDDNTARIWDAPPAVGQALLDRVRAALGRNAPDALKVPDQTQSFVGVIGKGFNTIRTRLTAMLL